MLKPQVYATFSLCDMPKLVINSTVISIEYKRRNFEVSAFNRLNCNKKSNRIVDYLEEGEKRGVNEERGQ